MSIIGIYWMHSVNIIINMHGLIVNIHAILKSMIMCGINMIKSIVSGWGIGRVCRLGLIIG